MTMLEDANNRSAGRWVLTPKKDEWFMGPAERERRRVRHRRKRLFVALLEAVGVSLLIGAPPPLHRVWIVTGLLVVALACYCALLLRWRKSEARAARSRRAITRRRRPALRPRYGQARTRTREEDLVEAFEAAGLQVAAFDPATDGPEVRSLVWEDGIRIIEDDVHVVVRRPETSQRRGAVSS